MNRILKKRVTDPARLPITGGGAGLPTDWPIFLRRPIWTAGELCGTLPDFGIG